MIQDRPGRVVAFEPKLDELLAIFLARVAETEREGWLGEMEGFRSAWLAPKTSLLKWTDELPAARQSTSACQA